MIQAPKLKARRYRVLRGLLWAVVLLLLSAMFLAHFVVLNSVNPPSEGLSEVTNERVDSAFKDGTLEPPVHFIYTIGCGGASDHALQLIQSTVVDSSFKAVGQRGIMTRLVSGCENDASLQQYMRQSVLPNLNVVFVPKQDQVKVPGEKHMRTYVQANRPFALKDFFRLPEIASADPRTVYVVIDPDFVFRKRLPEDAIRAVGPKRFVTQEYILASPRPYAHQACMEAFNSTRYCGNINPSYSFRPWYGGVPYMLLRDDWLKLLNFWIPLLGPVLLRYPGIESDMISWAMAASIAGLKGTMRNDFMATCMSSEDVDTSVLEGQVFFHLCQSYYVPETRPGDRFRVNNVEKSSHILHHKRWLYGAPYIFVFNKHWLKRSHLLDSCTVPLLLEPPPKDPNADFAKTPYYRWNLFVLRSAITAYNSAISEFRTLVMKCPPSSLEQSKALILHEGKDGAWNHAVDRNAVAVLS